MKKINAVLGVLLAFWMKYDMRADTVGSEGDGYVTLVSSAAKDGYWGLRESTWSQKLTESEWGSRDYLVSGSITFYPEYIANGVEQITVRSFTFGEVGGGKGFFHAYYSTQFGNEGVVFANGECYPNKTQAKIYGKATVASPATDPFVFRGWSGRTDIGLTLAGKLICEATNGLLVHSLGGSGFYLAFSGDASEYLGSVVVTSRYDQAGNPWGADLVFKGDASYFGGSVEVGDGATLQAQISTSIKSLTLRPGASLDIAKGSTLAIRDAFVKEGDGRIAVAISSAPSALSDIGDEQKYALVTMPAGSDCTVEDFSLLNAGSTPFTAPFAKMEESEDGKTKTLYAIYSAVKLVKDEANDFAYTDPDGSSSVTNAGYWSDGKVVHGDANYRIPTFKNKQALFSLPYQTEKPYVFPAPAVCFSDNTTLFLRAGESVITNVVFHNCDIYGLRVADREMALKSNFYLFGTLSLCLRTDFTLNLDGPVAGGENTTIKIMSMSNQTGGCRGWAKLSGDNRAFAGKIHITCSHRASNVSFDRSAFLTLSSPLGLGGPRAGFAYDALAIDSFGVLNVTETMTLDEPTRGVFVSDIARIRVAAEKRLALNEQLTVNGRLYKEHAGVLALGGPLRFVDSAGSLTDQIPEQATNRTLYVTGGKICALSAYSFDGLDIVFSNKASKLDMALALDVASADGALKRLGLCNSKSPNPLEVVDKDGKGKLAVELECTDPNPQKEYEFGIMTVRADCAGVLDLLKVAKPAGMRHYSLSLEKVADKPAGTVTLRGRLKIAFSMIVR